MLVRVHADGPNHYHLGDIQLVMWEASEKCWIGKLEGFEQLIRLLDAVDEGDGVLVEADKTSSGTNFLHLTPIINYGSDE